MPRIKSNKCSKCRTALRAVNCRYCLKCKAEYMKNWRKTNVPVYDVPAKAEDVKVVLLRDVMM